MLPRVNLIQCDQGDYLLFATRDAISTSLYQTGKWEEHILQLSRVFLSGLDAPLVLDIGANLGAYAIPVARDILPHGGSVYAFEAQRIVYYQLCGNVFLNRLDNVHAVHQAVGNSDGFVDIPEMNYESNNNVGAFSLSKEFRDRLDVQQHVKSTTCPVPMVRLDSLVLPKSPSLLKIDVEGYEIHVLRGGANFLREHNFPPIIFEAWHTDWFKAQKQEIFDFLTSLGYSISTIGMMEHVAQHERNAVHVEFVKNDNGSINLIRTR
jgi:FkbM family methyltransferase